MGVEIGVTRRNLSASSIALVFLKVNSFLFLLLFCVCIVSEGRRKHVGLMLFPETPPILATAPEGVTIPLGICGRIDDGDVNGVKT